MSLLICPYCGHRREEDNPFQIHRCRLCNCQFKPIKKKPECDDDAILTTRALRGQMVV